jgi:hypothetical protein
MKMTQSVHCNFPLHKIKMYHDSLYSSISMTCLNNNKNVVTNKLSLEGSNDLLPVYKTLIRNFYLFINNAIMSLIGSIFRISVIASGDKIYNSQKFIKNMFSIVS